jgi:hypothetical protein
MESLFPLSPEGVLSLIFGHLDLPDCVRLAQCLRGRHLEILRSTPPRRSLTMTFDFPPDDTQRRAMIGWMDTHDLNIRLAPLALVGRPTCELLPQSALDALYWLMGYGNTRPAGSRWLRMYWGARWFMAPDIVDWCGKVCRKLTVVGRNEVNHMSYSLRSVPELSLE